MPQPLAQKAQPPKSLRHWLGVIRRRHLYFLIPMFLGWVLVYAASWVIPARYKSSTLILVQQATMPRDYVTPNINEDLQERLQSITQQILSRTRLQHIIEHLHLFAVDHPNVSSDALVDGMRKNIQIELVRDGANQVTAFNVYYSNPNPQVAQQVTSELTNLFIYANLEVRQQQSEDTTK